MSYPEPSSQPHPEGAPEFVSARARRRRALRRANFPTDEAGRAELFGHLVRRAFPSYELFVFSFVAGAILGLGYLFNSQALLVFGILVAPLLTPWIGTTLSIVAGALRLFLQTLAALLVSSLIIFSGGWLAGYSSRPFQPLTLNEAFIHSRLWWTDLVALTIGAILITVSFAALCLFPAALRRRVWSGQRRGIGRALAAGTLRLLCPSGVGDASWTRHSFLPPTPTHLRWWICLYRARTGRPYRCRGHLY